MAMSLFDRASLLFVVGVAACGGGAQSSSGQPDAGSGTPPDATVVDAPTSGALPLGTVDHVAEVACAQGPGICETVTIECPGIESIDATLKIIAPAQPTRTVVVIGPGGGTKFYETAGLVDDYVAKGFRVVLVQWSHDWELSTTNPGLKRAGCRPATIYRYAYDHIHEGGTASAYCVHGSSGGAGAVGYALAQYGLDSIVDHALMSFGPVFSEVQYGCEPDLYTGPPRDLCPQLTDAPFAYNVNRNAPALDAWEGTSTCVVGTPSADDVATWTADSIDTGGTFDYPQTGTSFYYCVPANAGAGLGTFFIDRVNAASKDVTCFTDCAAEALTQTDMSTMTSDMDHDCVPRH